MDIGIRFILEINFVFFEDFKIAARLGWMRSAEGGECGVMEMV